MKTFNKTTGCADYREEMILLGLLRRLHDPNVAESEKSDLRKKVKQLQKEMGLETFTDDL